MLAKTAVPDGNREADLSLFCLLILMRVVIASLLFLLLHFLSMWDKLNNRLLYYRLLISIISCWKIILGGF